MKAQISAEFIFIAVLVLVASFTAFKIYKDGAFGMIAEATIKTSADWELAKAPLDSPDCGNTFLANISRNGTVGLHGYNISTTDSACTDVIFSDAVKARVNGLILVSLGCDYTDTDCKATEFRLY